MALSKRHGQGCAAALVLAFVACGSPEPAKAPPVLVDQFPTPAEPPGQLPLAPVPPILLRDVGFESPESALYDPAADVYLVSNIAGGPVDPDNNGFISKVAPDGTVLQLRWIDGASSGAPLHAPKGMALVGDTLFVADIDIVRSFDRNSGKAIGDVAIAGAASLNDIAAGASGALYVSDGGTRTVEGHAELGKAGADAVFVIDAQRTVKILAQGTNLGQPNGLSLYQSRLFVASQLGEVYALDAQGQPTVVAKAPGTGLDGMVVTPGGRLIVSSWDARTVYISKDRLATSIELEPLITDLQSPADLGYDPKRRQLIVPLLEQNAIYIQELPGGVN